MPNDNDRQAELHQHPWYWHLARMFGMASHPQSAEEKADAGEPGRESEEFWEWFAKQTALTRDRLERYRLFDEMDTYGLVQAVLDVYAEESTQKDYDRQRSVWIESKNPDMVRAGEQCLRNIRAEDTVTPMARRLAKRGDDFQRLIYQTGKGVLAWFPVPAGKVHRVEDKFTRLVGFREDGKKFRGALKYGVSWPWDYVHFRLMPRDEVMMYGNSLLTNLYRAWRMMVLAEDHALMYRLQRAPDRNAVWIDIGDMDDAEGMEYVNAWRKRFRKHEFIDPASPAYKKQYNPLTPLEDIFFPMRGNSNSRVEPLSGSANADDMSDIQHWRNVFFGSAKVPKAYFGFEGDINAKASLMQQDVRFARTIKVLQKAQLYGLRQTLDIHYTLLQTESNGDKYNLAKNPYLVMMAPIAYLDEWERLELLQLRLQIVEAMAGLAGSLQLDPRTWAAYVLLNYAKLPEDLVMKLVNKTPDAPLNPMTGMPAGASPMGGAPPEGGIGGEAYQGFYNLSQNEKDTVARVLTESGPLRRCVSRMAEYDWTDLRVIAEGQTDPSLVPPEVVGGSVVDLSDSYEDDTEAKTLQEHLQGLSNGKPLNEG